MLIIIPQPLGTNTVIQGVCVPLPLKLSTTGLVAQSKWSKPAHRGVTEKSENVIGKKQKQLLFTSSSRSSSPHAASPLRVFCALCMFDRPHSVERTTVDNTCAPCPTPASWLKTCRMAPVWDCLCNSCPSDMTYAVGWRVE